MSGMVSGAMRGAFAVCGLVVGLHSGAAIAEGWVTDCDAASRCTAVLSLVNEVDKTLVVRLGIQAGQNNADPLLVAFLPLGVALEPGFRAILGDREFPAPFQVCYPDGCRAVATLTPEDLSAWFGAPSASLQFFPFGSDKPVAVDAPLAGLAAALTRP